MAAGGMHSVALTAEGEVYTCGVNDEGALGRETSKALSTGPAPAACRSCLERCTSMQHGGLSMLCVYTEGAPWENSSVATGNTTESYRWAKVELPTEKGKVVQVSAGDPMTHLLGLSFSPFHTEALRRVVILRIDILRCIIEDTWAAVICERLSRHLSMAHLDMDLLSASSLFGTMLHACRRQPHNGADRAGLHLWLGHLPQLQRRLQLLCTGPPGAAASPGLLP